MYQLFYDFLLENVFNGLSAPWLLANTEIVAGIIALVLTCSVFVIAFSVFLWFVHFILHIFGR